MSLWSRLANVFRGDVLSREIDEELQAHIEEAVKQGRDPEEARRAFGSAVRRREESRDLRLIPWLDSLRADVIFGWRQLKKRKVTSAAAILSLALAIGACTSAFRLIDALLLRPLPVASPERLYTVAFAGTFATDGSPMTYDSCSYPMFQQMRTAVKDQAELIAVSMYNGLADLTYGSDEEMEKADLQYVSGWMFASFGLHPALGRLLTADDDSQPGAHPIAVLSYDYWARRFARDPNIVGRTFRQGNDLYQIVGVAEERFTGTETGWVTDVFVPMAMKNPRTLASLNNFWLRTLVQLKPGFAPEPVQEKLRATFRDIQEVRVKGFPAQSKRDRDRMFQERLLLEPAAAGRSNMQREYRRALTALSLLVALVLLIACANVANLMTAQAAMRAREMALRVSIGAGRWRLVQLVLAESAWLAFLAAAIGALFAWWSAPIIVDKISLPGYPARLVLPADWRVLGFGLALACGVTFLFGLAPALRASAVKPASALRGDDDPHSRSRLMHGLIAAQVAFCFVVHLVAGLFVATFERLSNQPTGFSAERILNVETLTQRPQAPVFWDQVGEHLRTVPGVEKVAVIGWPLLSGESAVGNISINGGPPGEVFSDFISISPGWMDIMRIPLYSGRDFRTSDTNPRVAMVNQAFAKQYFDGENPIGKSFERVEAAGGRARIEIVGLVADARSRDDMRRPIRPTAYIPFPSIDASGALKPLGRGTFVVRTTSLNPLALASTLRREVARAQPGFRVSNLRTQIELNQSTMVRERLLAMLAVFFAVVAMLLAGIGLYGVLDYSVLQRRREIGIRLAIGARAGDIARRVTAEVFGMVVLGAVAGLALGMGSVRYIETLLYQVKATNVTMLALPALIIVMAALLAALPAVIRAIRIDPVTMLRSE
ncbi:MAG TPA: ABC transporter permease [Bryobacteraceae bacterium]|jgi:predicted permease|nr:ABC transporter permease [Bryobacteraceae bacterium]